MRKKIPQIGEQHLKYNPNKCKKKGGFDILNGISENVTLVQLMETLGNVNNAISIVGHWIFDSNYKKAICLTQLLMDLICSLSIVTELVATFRSVFYAFGNQFILKRINVTLSGRRLNTEKQMKIHIIFTY